MSAESIALSSHGPVVRGSRDHESAAQRKPREWSPRIWEGADLFGYLRLLARGGFAIGPRQAYIAAICLHSTMIHTGLRWCNEAIHGQRIRKTRVQPPIFVLGHWRTGTTLLHELLIQDPRHASPSTLHCFVPNHFLLTESFFRRFFWFLVPEKRPMDNMKMGWDGPQEDEFALALLGQPSPYLDIAFPNRGTLAPGSLDLSGLTPAQLRQWKRTFLRFLQAVQLRYPQQRLVLKSPPHTARLRILLELFPEAKFVHIRRDPYVLFPSTVHLWQTLGRKQGLQTPYRDDRIREKVFREFRILYERYFADRALIPAGQLVELRYEDLAADLVGQIEQVYKQLQLDGFEKVRPHLEAFARERQGYERNRWTLTPELRQEIHRHWGDLIDQLGYGRNA